MSNHDIFNVNTFNPDRLRFSAVKEKDGRKSVYINYEKENGEMTPVYLQTPKMWTPFGPSAPSDKFQQAVPKWTLSMSFKNDGSDELQRFEKLLESIDNKIKNHGKEMASTYFPGVKAEHMDAFFATSYTSLLKPPKEGTTFPATVAPKVAVNEEGKFNTVVYDTSKNMVDFDKIPKGSNVIGILHIRSLYFAGKNSWGSTLGLPQVMVFPSKKLSGFQIQVNDSDLENTGHMVDETGSGEFEFQD